MILQVSILVILSTNMILTPTQSDYIDTHSKGKHHLSQHSIHNEGHHIISIDDASDDAVDFVSTEPDRYYCVKCKCGMKKPYVITQSGCGHNICWGCIQSLTRDGHASGLCPGDRTRKCTEFNTKHVRVDNGLKRDMKTAMVYCQNRRKGCLVKMQLKSLDAHMDECSYFQSPIMNDASSDYGSVTDNNMFQTQKPLELVDILKVVEELKLKCQSLEDKNNTLESKLQEALTPATSSEDSNKGKITQCVTCSGSHMKKMGELLNLHDITFGEFDVRLQCLENSSYNGKLIWRIRDFSEHVERAKSGKTLSLFSQPFYTSVHGYKMCGRLYPNGDGVGKGTHISLFIVIMRGTYDDLLLWPFQQKITLSLLDASGKHSVKESFAPNTKSSSFKKPVSEMNVASGCPTFFRQDKLKPFLVDNSLYLSIQVDTTGLAEIM